MVHMRMLKFSCRGELRVVRFRMQVEVYGKQGVRPAHPAKGCRCCVASALASRDMFRPLSTAATRLEALSRRTHVVQAKSCHLPRQCPCKHPGRGARCDKEGYLAPLLSHDAISRF
jgi:hypothetical protein